MVSMDLSMLAFPTHVGDGKDPDGLVETLGSEGALLGVKEGDVSEEKEVIEKERCTNRPVVGTEALPLLLDTAVSGRSPSLMDCRNIWLYVSFWSVVRDSGFLEA